MRQMLNPGLVGAGVRPVARLVSVAHDARDLPPLGSPSPDVDEAERATLLLPVLEVAEPMPADFHRAVVPDREDLETAWHNLASNPGRLPEHLAKVFLRLLVVRDALVVLIELHVAREEGHELRQVASVECAEERAVGCRDFV